MRKIARFIRDICKRGLKMIRSRYYFGRWDVRVHGRIQVGRNVAVGRGCSVNTGVVLQGLGRIEVGECVVLSRGCMLLDANLDIATLTRSGQRCHVPSAVRIGSRSWIGANAIILPGVELGPETIVGAGSIVTESFPQGRVVIAGNPARIIRTLEDTKSGTPPEG
jgi:acetyltransferase-like isoleucine patch superfamily enzyme